MLPTALPRRNVRTRLLTLCLLLTITTQSISCGTLLYPERMGQPRTGPLDPTVVALDAVGLLLFVVPGAIAFIVDIYNGTIFLPSAPYYRGQSPDAQIPESMPPGALIPVRIDPSKVTAAELEEVIRRETGRDVSLTDDNLRIERLESLNDFAERAAAAEQRPPLPADEAPLTWERPRFGGWSR